MKRAEAAASRIAAPNMHRWRDMLSFVDTGSSWVVAGGAHGAPSASLVSAATDAGRRVVFFGVESPSGDLELLHIGEQPYYERDAWRGQRSLREQVRRARRRGVTVRRVEARELAAGTELRGRVERLSAEWLARRRMEPMRFVVELDAVREWDPQVQIAAEVDGELVGFLSAVELADCWLVEHVLRAPHAPNGCAELLLDALFDAIVPATRITLGLAPLAGNALWQRVVRSVARPLYDFEGLLRFKERMHPVAWKPVWIAYPPQQTALSAIVDTLRAFAGGSLFRFAARTLWRRPGSESLALAVPLVPWTLFLFALAVSQRTGPLGFSGPALWGWAVFDSVLVAGMLSAALAPRRRLLGLLWTAATLDAVVSVAHVATIGLGSGLVGPLLRLLGTLAPVLAFVLLGRATLNSRRA